MRLQAKTFQKIRHILHNLRPIPTIGLQRAINCLKDFCEERSLKINVAKIKIIVFKTGGKVSRDENGCRVERKWR
jgi:hypothetical protein